MIWVLTFLFILIGGLNNTSSTVSTNQNFTFNPPHRFLYVATPGIRNYLEYGGHGLLVFDIGQNHKFIKRIPTQGIAPDGKPDNVKGIDVSLFTQCIYITTVHKLQCISLLTEKSVWEKSFDKGCDRLSISPDGKEIYVPSFEKEDWYILDAATGETKRTISPNIGSHNTIYGVNGKEVYLEGLKSPYLTIVNTQDIDHTRQVGPFINSIRPFTVNGKQDRVFVNANELLGFEAGDLIRGNKIYSITVNGYSKGAVKRHGCPSHGIALTPDEKELWLADAFNQKVHIFEMKGDQLPIQKESISLRDQPGWITFTTKGDYAYPSTGEVIDPHSKKILLTLQDENGIPVQSEKMVEIDFVGKKVFGAGDQFGLGRVYGN